MKRLALALKLLALCAAPAAAGFFGPPASGVIATSTQTITINGAVADPNQYPTTPLLILGNSNTYQQIVLQNLSNGTNASGDLVLVNDLGGDTSYYFDLGINSSKFSQAGQTVEASSSTFLASSDSDLVLWAGTNGGLNKGASETIILGSSNPVTGNRSAVFSSSTINMIAPVTISSAAFLGVHVATQTAGGAGASVTALCQTNVFAPGTTFALGGGCSCASAVGETSNIGIPNCATTGCVPTGWTCQIAGGTGGQCSAYAICSRAQ